MAKPDWHRVFHPLCGADLLTLLRLARRRGPPQRRAAYALALLSALGRLPFTLGEAAAWAALRRGAHPPPVFVIGHPRSGTTHLHNLLAATGRFATAPAVLTGMPWEARSLARLMRPFIDMYLPPTRFIDAVAVRADGPTEDEIALAAMAPLSPLHAVFFPSRFEEDWRRAFLPGPEETPELVLRERALALWAAKLARRAPGRPPLMKSPAFTGQVARLRALFPGARFVHIRREPEALFDSARRMIRDVLRELALQDGSQVDVDAAALSLWPELEARLARDLAGAKDAAELDFEALARDPLDALGQVWRRLGLEDWPAAAAGVEAYLAELGDYRPRRHRLTPAEAARLRAAWGAPRPARAAA
jgi:hypothetical protein